MYLNLLRHKWKWILFWTFWIKYIYVEMIIHLYFIHSKSWELVWDAATKVIVNYKYIMYMSTTTKFNVIYCNHIILTPYLSQPSQPLLPSRLKLEIFTTYPKWTLNEYVWKFSVFFTYMIESIDSKLIFMCFINDYSLIGDLHIFVYGRAECAIISLKCTKVKHLILNNFCCNF